VRGTTSYQPRSVLKLDLVNLLYYMDHKKKIVASSEVANISIMKSYRKY